jgi:type I site-specific restriction endonuclease
MDRSKNEKTVDAHTMHTVSLKSTARSSKLKGADMRGIQKIPNKDGTKSYKAQVRLNDGLPLIEMVIDQLTSRGVMEASALYDPPFSNLHSGGPDTLFVGKKNVIDGIFGKLDTVNASLSTQTG